MSRIDEILARTKGPDVLDVGCSGQAGRRSAIGSPLWLHGRLLEQFPATVGLEYDQANVAVLQAAGIHRVMQGDAHDFTLDQRFDTIVAGELIEHLDRPADFLASARRHLKPGGRLVLTTPYAFSLMFIVYAWLKYPQTCSNPEHVAWYCPATLTALATSNGFRVQSCAAVATYRSDLRWTARVANGLLRTVGRILPDRVRANTLVAVLVAD